MTGIPLRDYIREIDKQVDGKRYDEAIAHSRYLLQTYPKHIDVYRLLGKAFLESQRYGDAADIFQRVLSAVPDDFVSHAGMSIIREDEGNFDEAIWHMKRAFDVQPSNSAIQEELRRMIGRRDNVEPPKIRLTRGALARMYFKGELYPQAIAETRAALAESPDRVDLQALLAEIYFAAGQKTEAVDVANNLLRRLPYCLVANRILFDSLKSSDREAEVRLNLERLSQLDPYYTLVGPSISGPESIPDDALRIEKLDWKVGQTQVGRGDQPLWAASLGIDLGESLQSGSETLPDWLSPQPETVPADEETEGAAAFFSDIEMDEDAAALQPDLEAALTPGDDQIPEWMKDLGWSPASPESRASEAEISLSQEASEEAAEEALAPSNLPDWLQAISPPEGTAEAAETKDATPWLDRMPSAAVSQEPSALPEAEPAGDEGLPDWLKAGLAAGAVGAALSDRDETGEEFPAGVETEPESKSEVPDAWLAAGLATGAAAFLSNEPEDRADSISGIEAEHASASDLPEWLIESETPEETSETVAEASDLPIWLTGIDADKQISAADLEAYAPQTSAPVEGEQPLDWLSEGATEPGLTPGAGTPVAEELPEWLFETESGSGAAPSDTAADVLPEWLRTELTVEGSEFESEHEATTLPGEEPMEESVSDVSGLPDWLLQDFSAEDTTSITEPAGIDAEEFAAEPESASEWLPEIEPSSAAEMHDATEIPVWLAAAAVGEVEKGSHPAVSLDAEVSTPPATAADTAELEDAFNWLSIMLRPQPKTPAQIDEAVVTPPGEAEEIAPFIEQPLEEAQLVAEAAVPPETPSAGSDVDYSAMPLDEDAAFAWLESLAVQQGATEALLLAPEERQEAPPEWVQQAAAAAEVVEEVQPEAIPEAVEVEDSVALVGMQAVGEEYPSTFPEPEAEAAGSPVLLADEPLMQPVSPALEEGAEVPELPDWLAGGDVEAREEILEWQPPVVTHRRYDLNLCSLAELERLPGIGFIMAQRIVDYRQEHGRFENIEDLLNIADFTEFTLDGIRDNLYVTPVEPPAAPVLESRQPDADPPPVLEAPPPAAAPAPEAVLAARELASAGEWDSALNAYHNLITNNEHLDAVIVDLSTAAQSRPQDMDLWQHLGDAYLRSNRVKEALDAYAQAERLLRL